MQRAVLTLCLMYVCHPDSHELYYHYQLVKEKNDKAVEAWKKIMFP